MVAYVLDNDYEGERLEKQNIGKLYQVDKEMQRFDFTDNEKILDVGCGTGALTRYVLNVCEKLHVTALDLSPKRLEMAKKIMGNQLSQSVTFICGDISDKVVCENSFDTVMSRFVLHHVTDPYAVIKSMTAALKENGRLIVVDSDGIMFNFFSEDEWLMSALERIKNELSIDLYVGRKLKTYFSLVGLQNIESTMIPMHFTKNELELEIVQYEDRFEAMEELLNGILGEDATKFKFRYINALKSKRSEIFYNKFVCSGVKVAKR
jgi:ubiquinone/menaquinone biosynthesis C-methylase UbiE